MGRAYGGRSDNLADGWRHYDRMGGAGRRRRETRHGRGFLAAAAFGSDEGITIQKILYIYIICAAATGTTVAASVSAATAASQFLWLLLLLLPVLLLGASCWFGRRFSTLSFPP